jgi:nickel transport protein
VTRPAWLLVAALALLSPAAARGHEVLHEIERGRAVAVKAFFADGEVLAYQPYEIYSPADPRIPYQKGRTDRSGWLSFVPDVPGRWRVKVLDETGHGLDLEVDAAADAAAGAAAPSSSGGASPTSSVAFVLRPLVGVAVIVVVFGVLYVLYRRKGPQA